MIDQDVLWMDALTVEDCPVGAVSRVMVKMVQDGMGMPQYLPVLVARGAMSGPVFGITCALHGNEVNGIPVVHQLFSKLHLKTLRGTIVAVLVANLPAYNQHQRWFSDGRDLNHLFPGDHEGDVSKTYVARLLDRIVRRFDLLLDLHTASVGRVNSLYVRADMQDPATARMAYLQRPQIIVHNTPNDRTLRGAAAELGIPAITVEIGNPQRFQPEYIKKSLVGARSVLAAAGMIQRREVAEGDKPILCGSSEWSYTNHGGLLEVYPKVVARIEQGATYARLSNIWGDPLHEYVAPKAGVIIGKAVDPVAETGARIAHIGFEATPGDGTMLDREACKEGLQQWRA